MQCAVFLPEGKECPAGLFELRQPQRYCRENERVLHPRLERRLQPLAVGTGVLRPEGLKPPLQPCGKASGKGERVSRAILHGANASNYSAKAESTLERPRVTEKWLRL
jgi:hypothetical protein